MIGEGLQQARQIRHSPAAVSETPFGQVTEIAHSHGFQIDGLLVLVQQPGRITGKLNQYVVTRVGSIRLALWSPPDDLLR
jgi:hypothetical protein